MRHAKSDWSAGQPDHGRPLNERRRLAAPLMAAWLAERGLVPGTVLLSDAARTRETWARMRRLLDEVPEPVPDPGLYHAGPQAIAAGLEVAPGPGPVLLIAHEPGISAAARLVSGGPEPARMPTAAIAVLEGTPGAMRLAEVATPKALV